jgi:transcriptional regulator with XRE-family HTH domain
MSLVENIKQLCKSHNTSILGLEKELGFSNGMTYHWNTSSPTVGKLLKVADYFGVTTDYLLGREQLSHEESEVKNKMPEQIKNQEVLAAAYEALDRELKKEPLSAERMAALTETIRVLSGINILS